MTDKDTDRDRDSVYRVDYSIQRRVGGYFVTYPNGTFGPFEGLTTAEDVLVHLVKHHMTSARIMAVIEAEKT